MIDERVAVSVVCIGRVSAAGIQLLGTAFALGGDLFVTAAHLTSQSDEGLVVCSPKVKLLSEYQDTTDHSVGATKATIVRFDPISDLAVLRAEGVDVKTGITLAGADEAPPGTRVTSIGFPHCVDGRMVLTHQSLSVGARVLLPVNNLKRKHLVLNTFARPGQSGSPIFQGDSLVVCAVLLGSYVPKREGTISLGGIDPASLHQTTHAVSAEYIREML